jgi:hypothetical protein
MVSDSVPPAAVSEVRVFLEKARFKLASERSGGMGGLEQIYAGSMNSHEVLVRISADRGHWALEVKVPSMTRWILSSVWTAYLDRRGIVELPVEVQAAFVITRLADVVECGSDPAVEANLVKMGTDYMRNILGLDQ